jgi:hypothetical protein
MKDSPNKSLDIIEKICFFNKRFNALRYLWRLSKSQIAADLSQNHIMKEEVI